MSISIINKELPKDKYGVKAPYSMNPIGITIHETDNNASAANEIAYMQRNNNEVSFHFAVDESEIIQGVPLNRNTWHASDGYGGRGNRTTISIEICRNYRTDDLTNYYAARENAEKLVGYLLNKYGWTDKDIYTHNDWNGKNCPRVIRQEGYLSTFKANAMKHKGGKPANPSTKDVNIMGSSQVSAKDLTDYVKIHNASFDHKIAEAFISIGNKYGVRGDMALAQSILETGWFKFAGSSVKPEQNNFCGLGATGGGNPGHSFPSIEEGVRAQIQHLFAYASKANLPAGESLVDPRFKFVTRGVAPKWVDLNGKWATGANYGEKILNIFSGMSGVPSQPSQPSKPVPVPKKTPAQVASEIWSGKGGWGNNPERQRKIEAAGINYSEVVNEINKLSGGSKPKPVPVPKKTPAQVASEIWTGKGGWGNNPERQRKIEAAGISYSEVVNEINKLSGGSKPNKPKFTAQQIADQIWTGKGNWGTNPGRKQKIIEAGANPDEVQKILNNK